MGTEETNTQDPPPTSTAIPDGEQALSVLRAGPSSLLLPCCCPRHPRGQLHPGAVFSFPSHYIIYHYLSPRCQSTMVYIFRLYRAKTDSAGVGYMPSRNISAVLLTSVTPCTVAAICALHSSPASAPSCSLPPPTSHHSLQVTLLTRTRPQVRVRSHQPSSLWGSCEPCHVSPPQLHGEAAMR